MNNSRLYSLLRSTFGRDLGCSADWEGSAFRVAGVVTGWYLIENPCSEGGWTLVYRFFNDDRDEVEVEREFAPLELLFWLRGAGLREFRRVVSVG